LPFYLPLNYTKSVLKLSDEDQHAIKLLLTPSWLSGLVAIVAGLVVSFGVIIVFSLNNSALQQQLLAWEQTQPRSAMTSPYQNLPENDHPTLKGSWPLLLVWGGVGMLVYAAVAIVLHDLGRAEELRESLNYVNARPQTALATTAEHLLLRLIAFVVLVVVAIFCLRQVIPYCITAADASAADFFSLDGGLYALLSFGPIAVSLHVLTILARLSLGRSRVFSSD
jgi:hypothetical protein